MEMARSISSLLPANALPPCAEPSPPPATLVQAGALPGGKPPPPSAPELPTSHGAVAPLCTLLSGPPAPQGPMSARPMPQPANPLPSCSDDPGEPDADCTSACCAGRRSRRHAPPAVPPWLAKLAPAADVSVSNRPSRPLGGAAESLESGGNSAGEPNALGAQLRPLEPRAGAAGAP